MAGSAGFDTVPLRGRDLVPATPDSSPPHLAVGGLAKVILGVWACPIAVPVIPALLCCSTTPKLLHHIRQSPRVRAVAHRESDASGYTCVSAACAHHPYRR